jgi:hypothetical protein
VDGIAAAAVIGAGVMGSGIAAQFANAGIPVLLLDLVPGDGRRNALAEAALQRLKRSDPPAFMHRSAEALVTPGNVDDHFGRLAEADWIVEAVVEELEVKRALLGRVAAVAKPGAVLSSNTSTLMLAALTRGLGPEGSPAAASWSRTSSTRRATSGCSSWSPGPRPTPTRSRPSRPAPRSASARRSSRSRTGPASSRTGSAATGSSPPSRPPSSWA